MERSKDIDPRMLHAALSEVVSQEEQPGALNSPLSARSRDTSGTDRPKEKRVGFSYDEPDYTPSGCTTPANSTSRQAVQGDTDGALFYPTIEISVAGPSSSEQTSLPLSRVISHDELSAEIHKVLGPSYPSIPKPAIRNAARAPSKDLRASEEDEEYEYDERKRHSKLQARESAQKLARAVQSWSAPGSRRNSFDDLEAGLPRRSNQRRKRKLMPFAPLRSLRGSAENSEDEDAVSSELGYRNRTAKPYEVGDAIDYGARSGQTTPINERRGSIDAEYVPKPRKYRRGRLSTLLNLGHFSGDGGYYDTHELSLGRSGFSGDSTVVNSADHTPLSSGTSTPTRMHWYHHRPHSTASISELIRSSSVLAAPGADLGPDVAEKLKATRPPVKKHHSSSTIEKARKIWRGNKYSENERKYRIKEHIEEIICRQRYLVKLCKALMKYGAPTHRLEEYMTMSARVLEIEGSFLYIPGCMIISFDDSSLGVGEVKIVRTPQGVDLGRLQDTHEIYKDTIHDRIGVGEATARLDEVLMRNPKFNPWALVPVYGLASATVAPFAFQARWIDLPMCFLLGSIVGILQLILAPRSALLTNVFEIFATVITSFLARFLGSFQHGNLFCFSALAQSSIALILPGYTVLCASLELQSRNIVSGSVRMVYAIMYSFFLGFGITIGTAIYGLLDRSATSQTQCSAPLTDHWYQFFPFVPAFTLCLIVINQAKWRQAPLMLLISCAGYGVNYVSSKHFAGNAPVANTLGALAIGVLANLHVRLAHRLRAWAGALWSRTCAYIPWRAHTAPPSPSPLPSSRAPTHSAARKVGYGLAAAAMLPAIFVQVPSGLAVSGSLVAGIASADQLTGNVTGTTTTTTVSGAADAAAGSLNSVAFNVGYSVVQVSIGITVGLFLAALAVYPFGKRRSGLFTF